jgi:hypothetical protein
VAVEIDADAGPVEARRHLLDVRRLAGSVVTLDHHAAVVLEAREDREGHIAIEKIIRIEIRDVLISLGIGRNFKIAIDSEDLTDGQLHVRHIRGLGARGARRRAHKN